MPTYINGFSTCSRAVIGTFRVPGTTRSIPVRREVAPLLLGFSSEFDRYVESIDTGVFDDWGYHCRTVTGPSASPSFHAAGLAVDLNATRHPYGRRGTFSSAQAATIRRLCAKYGLRWGGDYRYTKDEMHFEVIIGRPQALALVKRLQTPVQVISPSPVRPVPTGSLSRPLGVARQGASNPVNGWVQRIVGVRVDGKFGPETRDAVIAWQKRLRVTPDGVVGPATWRAYFAQYGVMGQGNRNIRAVQILQFVCQVPMDGYWGPMTTAALKNKQRGHGLGADGKFGPASRARLIR